MVSPDIGGFGIAELEQAQMVGKSLMAQFETLTAERNPKFTKKCCVSYAKMLLVPAGE